MLLIKLGMKWEEFCYSDVKISLSFIRYETVYLSGRP